MQKYENYREIQAKEAENGQEKAGKAPEFYPKAKGIIFARVAMSEKFAALSMYSAAVSKNPAALFVSIAALSMFLTAYPHFDGVHSSAASRLLRQ